jgi:energy-coupling factor transport system ATP-binding protein
MATSPVAPPVVELGRLAGWSPLPLSIRDARRQATSLRDRLAAEVRRPHQPTVGPLVADVHRLVVRYGDVVALRSVDLQVRGGEIVALMGRNGAGKSTLLSTLVGMTRANGGTVRVCDDDPHALRPRDLVRRAGLVPQEASDLLYADTVARECAQADHDAGAPDGTTAALLSRIAPGIAGAVHPRDLSEGQQLALALAVVLAGRPPLVLLDEPTRGLDYPGKRDLASILAGLATSGHAVVLATHDVELAAAVATRTVVLAEGEIVSDGPTADVVTSSPAFAPQVAKVLAPGPWLTVDEVALALRQAG